MGRCFRAQALIAITSRPSASDRDQRRYATVSPFPTSRDNKQDGSVGCYLPTMSHAFKWPEGTGVGTGTCSRCATTLTWARVGPRKGKHRRWVTASGSVHLEGETDLSNEPPCVVAPEIASMATRVSQKESRRTGREIGPLRQAHRQELAELIWGAVQVAKRAPALTRVAISQIKHLSWRWTADGFSASRGEIVPDALKYDFDHQHHTARAMAEAGQHRSRRSKVLRHEHAVPRRVLAREALKCASPDEIEVLFAKHCVAVLVTLEEDGLLNQFRSEMPEGWARGGDSFARYSHERVNLPVRPPKGIGNG